MPDGQHYCRFRNQSYFSAPDLPFLREDLLVCTCDNAKWIHHPGKTKEGIKVKLDFTVLLVF